MRTRPTTSLWHEPFTPSTQFSLRTLLELASICCVVCSMVSLNLLLTVGVGAGLMALWSLRVRHWKVQMSLTMLCGGVSSVSLGTFFIMEGFRLIPIVLWQHSLPDFLITIGPFCVVMGLFAGTFGVVTLLLSFTNARC